MSIKKRVFIDKQGKEQTRYRVNVYDKYTGKTRWVGTFARKKDAEREFDKVKTQIRMGEQPRERKDIGFSDLVDRWFQSLTVRDTTRAEYKYTTAILRRHFKNRPVSEITRERVELFIAWASKQRYSDRYVRKLKTRLSQVLGVAVDWGYLSANPAAGKMNNLPREPKSKIRALEPDQVKRLLAAAPDYHRALFLLLLGTGLRRSEAFGLTWDNVDLDKGEIHVMQQLQKRDLADTKTPAGMRTIPLAFSIVTALRERKAACPEPLLNLVFTTERGTPINPSNFYKRLWTPVKQAAQIPESTTLHQLRKTFASECASHGRTPAWLAEVMGHESPTTTLAFYTGVLNKEREQARQDLDDWLTQEAPAPYLVTSSGAQTEAPKMPDCSIAVARTHEAA